MQIELPVSPTPADGFRLQKLKARFGTDRGTALSRVAEGLRENVETRDDDIDLVLKSLADAITSAEA